MQKKQKSTDPLAAVTEKYTVSVTDDVLETINPDDPNDPVARQYLPSIEELTTTQDELADPIGDDAHSPVKGIVHRYPDRVLLKPVHVCPVYCRFCFRREKVGPGKEMLSNDELRTALDYIRATPAIWEVIVTGGDPFILSPRRLSALMREIEKIEHVKIVRFHTRVPVADPSRVTDELVAALQSQKTVYVAIHCNHVNELTEKTVAATEKLIRAGVPLLAQTVLLKDVNDDAETLERLFRRLTEMKIRPYYLHHPDKAPGTSHFRLPIRRGQEIMKELWRRLSGIARPTYVLDIPGGAGKIPVSMLAVEKMKDGNHTLTDRDGKEHSYSD